MLLLRRWCAFQHLHLPLPTGVLTLNNLGQLSRGNYTVTTQKEGTKAATQSLRCSLTTWKLGKSSLTLTGWAPAQRLAAWKLTLCRFQFSPILPASSPCAVDQLIALLRGPETSSLVYNDSSTALLCRFLFSLSRMMLTLSHICVLLPQADWAPLFLPCLSITFPSFTFSC